MSVFFSRTEVNVDVIHTLFLLEKGFRLDRLGIPFLIGGADLFRYDV